MDDAELTAVLRRGVAEVGEITGQGCICYLSGAAKPLVGTHVCDFCRYCITHPATAPYCQYALQSAAMQTLSSGEPHYQRCWAGILQIAVAVAPGNDYRGGIALGGFYATGEQNGLADQVLQRLAVVPGLNPAPFMQRLDSLREMDAGTLRGMGLFLFETTLSSGINSGDWFRHRHEAYLQQREIAEAYVDLKESNIKPPDIMADTYQLVAYLHRRDQEGAMQFISGYLAKLLLLSNWNLVKLRAYVRVLLAVITSQDVLDGMDWDSASRREWLYLSKIEKADGPEAICTEVAELVLHHFGRSSSVLENGQALTDRVSEWLERNLHRRATLQDAAREVGASVSLIAHRLPQETGKTFSQLRREVRLARAKRLLATSRMNISEIADACGFVDQSHFTRIFKQETSLTPGMFRKLL